MNDFPIEETEFGFNWGPVKLERLLSDKKFGVLLGITTRWDKVELRITPAGRILIHKWRG